jgi:hypothetical protein
MTTGGESGTSVELVEGHEQPLPSIEPDMIDNLAQPISCSFILLVGESFQMEVGRGLVYPRQTMHGDVEIHTSSYDVVKVDMVHKNSKDLKLEVTPDDMTLTMRDTITRRVQWRQTSIDVDTSAVASTSTTPSQPNTSPASIFPKACMFPSPNPEQLHLSPDREQPHPSPILEQSQKSSIQEQAHLSPILEQS